MRQLLDAEILKCILAETPIIDVRAPVEFNEGALPGAINLPIMNDEERAQVGTTYKKLGQEAAIKLGHELVSGSVKGARVQSWRDFVARHPETILTCYRGGLRSKISQQWLQETGVEIPRINGGYKKARQLLLQATEDFCQQRKLLVISGATGSGKTLLLRSLGGHRQICDLEALANHRGSAFGGYLNGQPKQSNFDNALGKCFLGFLSGVERHTTECPAILIEDESRLIGRSVQPDCLFNLLRSSPVILIEESVSERVEVTYADYILGSKMATGTREEALMIFDLYQSSLLRISKKLGGLRYAEVKGDIDLARQGFLQNLDLLPNKVWIEKLLVWYYDPMYLGSLQKRQPEIIFRGSRKDCFRFLLDQ